MALIAWRLFVSELDRLSMISTAGGGACRLQGSRHASLTASPARKLCRQAIKAVLRFALSSLRPAYDLDAILRVFDILNLNGLPATGGLHVRPAQRQSTTLRT